MQFQNKLEFIGIQKILYLEHHGYHTFIIDNLKNKKIIHEYFSLISQYLNCDNITNKDIYFSMH